MRKITGNTNRILAVILLLTLLITSLNITAYAGEAGSNADNEDENIIIDPANPFGTGYRNYGYVEPEDTPYSFAEDGEEAAKGHIEIVTGNENGILRSSITALFAAPQASRYITSDPSYAGGGSVPNIADPLKADDQKSTSICWIYATNKAVEANIYKKGKNENLSEKNTAYYFWNKADVPGSEGDALRNSYNYLTYTGSGSSAILKGREQYGLGGDASYLDDYFAAWKGLVRDTGSNKFEQSIIADKVKMYGTAGTITSPSATDVYSKDIGHVQNIYRTPVTDADAIKTLIKNYGAVTAAVFAHQYLYKKGTNAWYNSLDASPNHQILIIGWDDNYSRDNFTGAIANYYGKPSHNGAWYCINSWGLSGSGCDANGGFWLSYEDNIFSRENEKASAYDVALSGSDGFYDHNYVPVKGSSIKQDGMSFNKGEACGVTYKAEGLGNTTGYEQIKAIGFYTFDSDTKWTIRGYKGETAEDGVLVTEQTATIPYTGFHTIELITPFKVQEGESFHIEIVPVNKSQKIARAFAGYAEEMKGNSAIDYNGKTYEYKRTIQYGPGYGKSYRNGKLETKAGLGTTQYILHAYTIDCGAPDRSTLSARNISTSYIPGKTFALSDYYTFKAGKDDAGNTTTIVSAKSSNSSVASVNLTNNKVTVNGTGTAKITLTTSDYVTATLTVTVSKYSLTNVTISGTADCTYDGAQKKPAVTVTAGGITLVKDRDYAVSYGTNTDAGEGSVTVTGQGNYTGSKTKTFTINQLAITRNMISGVDSLYKTTGSAVRPVPVITYNGYKLVSGTDYTVTYGENTSAGNGTVTVTGKGNYKGTVTVTFQIEEQILVKKSEFGRSWSSVNKDFGEVNEIPFDSISKFYKGTDSSGNDTYLSSVSSDNTSVARIDMANRKVLLFPEGNPDGFLACGSAYIRMESSDGVTDTVKVTINPESITGTDTAISYFPTTYEYQGEPVKVNPDIIWNNSHGSVSLEEGRDYYIEYKNNDKPGLAEATIMGMGDFWGAQSYYLWITEKSSFINTDDKLVTYAKDGDIPISDIAGFVHGYEKDAYNLTTENSRWGGIGIRETTIKTITTDNADAIAAESGRLTIKGTGEANITITSSDNESATVNVTVVQRDIAEADVTGVEQCYLYTGDEIKPEAGLSLSGNMLNKGRDYNVDYSFCIDPGTGVITFTGKGNYSGTLEYNFAISGGEMRLDAALDFNECGTAYTGDEINPTVTVTSTDLTGSKNIGKEYYTVSYKDNTNAGTAKAEVTMLPPYDGVIEKAYTISPANISAASISGLKNSYVFTGSEIVPVLSVVYNGHTLSEGTDYSVKCSNNVNAGTASITLTGKGNFKGSVSETFLIRKSGGDEPEPENPGEGTLEASIDLPSKGIVYTGSEIKPAVTVKYTKNGSRTIVGTGEYDVEYSNNINVGTASAKITLSDAYENKVITKTFTIYPAKIGSAAITGIKKSYVYAGAAVIPAMTLTYNKMVLTEGTDYAVEYADNNAPGTATYTFTGINNFSGERTGEYTINAEATGEEEIEVPVDPIPETPDEPDPEPQPEDPEENPETPEENKGEQPSEAEKAVTESDNKPMDYRTEEKGEYKISYGHGVPFWGNSKITAEYFGHITVSHNGAEYKATKIKVNKKKRLIQILKLAGADKATIKAVKKATKGAAGLSFTMNPYYVKNSDTVSIKTKKDGSIKSLKVTINGKAYKAKKSEFSQDSSTGKISFLGNLAGSYGGNETGSEASAASIETVNISNAGDYDTVYAPEDVPEAPETKETADIEETVETEEKIEYGASEGLYEETESVSVNEIETDDEAAAAETGDDTEGVEDAVMNNDEMMETDIPENDVSEEPTK